MKKKVFGDESSANLAGNNVDISTSMAFQMVPALQGDIKQKDKEIEELKKQVKKLNSLISRTEIIDNNRNVDNKPRKDY